MPLPIPGRVGWGCIGRDVQYHHNGGIQVSGQARKNRAALPLYRPMPPTTTMSRLGQDGFSLDPVQDRRTAKVDEWQACTALLNK